MIRAWKRKCKTSWRARDARGGAAALEGFWVPTNQTTRTTRKHALSGSALQRNAAWRVTHSTRSRAIPRRRHSTLRTRWHSSTTRKNLRIWIETRSCRRMRRSQAGIEHRIGKEVKVRKMKRAMDKSGEARRGPTKTWRWRIRSCQRGRRRGRGKRRYLRRKYARLCKRLRAASGFVHILSYCFWKTCGLSHARLQEYRALDPEDVSWMDQELAEADEGETSHMRVRIAPSTNASKAQPHRAQPTDADMDVVLVRFPTFPRKPNLTDRTYKYNAESDTRKQGRATGRCIRATHETMGQRRRRPRGQW